MCCCLPCQPSALLSLPTCTAFWDFHILNMQSTIKNGDEYLLTSFHQTMPSSQTDFSYLKGTKHWEEQPILLITPSLFLSHLPGPPMIGNILHFFFIMFIIKLTFPYIKYHNKNTHKLKYCHFLQVAFYEEQFCNCLFSSSPQYYGFETHGSGLFISTPISCSSEYSCSVLTRLMDI